jgi:hypothetical protein
MAVFGGVEEEVHSVCPASAGHKRYKNLLDPKDMKTFRYPKIRKPFRLKIKILKPHGSKRYENILD